MTTILRSGGHHIGFGLVAGGGSFGITAELDRVVAEAAAALAAAYSTEVVIRFNSDRESGGAFLVTPDGDNAGVGITASLVTARARRQSGRPARPNPRLRPAPGRLAGPSR